MPDDHDQRDEREALLAAVIAEPRRDNGAYLKAMTAARAAFAEAEAALGGPVCVRTKVKRKGADKVVVKWVFTREG